MLTRNDSLKTTNNCYLNANKVEYIVVHYTALLTDIRNFCLNQKNNDCNGSAHDFVSETEWYQSIDPKHGAYSVGDDNGYGRFPNGITNTNSLNIEMVADAYSLPPAKTIENTAEIVAYYMKLYKVPLDKVVRHYDASYKQCPYNMHGSNNAEWAKFKGMVKNYYDGKVKKTMITKYNGKYINMGDWCPRWRIFDIFNDELLGEIIPKAHNGLSYEILGCTKDTDKEKMFIIKTGFAGLVSVLHWEDGNSSITDVPKYGDKKANIEEGKKIEELEKENKELKEKIEAGKKALG